MNTPREEAVIITEYILMAFNRARIADSKTYSELKKQLDKTALSPSQKTALIAFLESE